VTPFALDVLTRRFQELGLNPTLRMLDGAVRVTDEGNRILDVHVPEGEDIGDVVAGIRAYAGVVETGYFPTEATEAIIAGAEGLRRMTR
jgi:ribose 5-phosphate isomerase A